jgi:L-threonylcarbamoyladenylate synthase
MRRGAVIVYPTDTAYAIGCDATNAAAVRRIFRIKGRPADKAMPMICADLRMAKKYFLLTAHCSLLTREHWPGPLSVVVKAKKGIAKAALGRGTAAIRVPDSDIARTLSKFLGRPLIATSANLSGRPACYSIGVLLRQMAGRTPPTPSFSKRGSKHHPSLWKREGKEGSSFPDLVLDAGALPKRRPSTIIKMGSDGSVTVLRRGPISIALRPARRGGDRVKGGSGIRH